MLLSVPVGTIVGVRDGCRLRVQRLIIVCILFCRQVSLMSLL